MTNFDRVQKAIAIQGYITLSVGGRERKVTAVEQVGDEWITNLMTPDLCGYVRIRKTRAAVVAQAKAIIADEANIRAKRDAERAGAAARMMN